MRDETDIIVVGGGLAGLVAACEAAEAGARVTVVDQEGEQSLGGQAFWSLGGLFLVDTPEQRRLRIQDCHELALRDWLGSARFDRPEDYWPRRWAEAYVAFAAGEKRSWLHARGVRWFPVVGWAERGGGLAGGHGNSVPRFHMTWGTGPAVVAPFAAQARSSPNVRFLFRHRVDELLTERGTVVGVRGTRLQSTSAERGKPTARIPEGDFELRAGAVIVASGGIGANHELVRRCWPERLGRAPEQMICGVPDYVDGTMLEVSERGGASLINRDRMWHYTEGIQNWNPIWTNHGIRIIPGPSSLWFDALGRRMPAPCYPGFDTLGTLEHIQQTGFDYTWFVLTQKIIEKEFALSGSEQNPDVTGKSVLRTLARALPGAPPPVEAFKKHGADFVVRDNLDELVRAMNALTPEPLLDVATLTEQIRDRDNQMANPFCKDMQVMALRSSRAYLGDRLIRTATPHRILDPKAGPLIAVRLHILTRKTLGGLETDLSGRVLRADSRTAPRSEGARLQSNCPREPLPGLYAAGEAAGFGGGGLHGYRALEGTFLGGCIFSGRAAGRAAGAAAKS